MIINAFFRKMFSVGGCLLASIAWMNAAVAGPATHIEIDLPNPAVSYQSYSENLSALDAANAIDTTYNGTVVLMSSDPNFFGDGSTVTFVNGTVGIAVAFKIAGTQSVTATDTVNSAITGTASTLVVPGATQGFYISAPGDVTPGLAFNITVTAHDLYGNTTPAYAGTVHFTSSDGSAALPADSTLTAGVGTFSVTLNTRPTESITATDTVDNSITGSSGSITTPVRLQSFSVD